MSNEDYSAEIKKLKALHKATKDKKLAYKINALILYFKNYTYEQIEDALLIDERTIRRYRDIYFKDGATGLMENKYKGGFSKLSKEQKQKLITELNQTLYSSSKEICSFVQSSFGVKYTPEGMVQLLHTIGFSYKKTKNVPCKADRAKQEEFIKQYRIMRAALLDSEKLYFMDGVHPTHNVNPDYAWIETGEERAVKSNSGRQRVNINGVYSPQDHEIIVREDETINSDSTINLLKEIEARHPELTQIYIIRDNARYYCSAPVREYLETSKIVFVPLPSYSPNLNLIERLWKFFKKKVISNRYYEKYSLFKDAVMNFFDEEVKTYTDELDTLMTENFHLFKFT